VACSKACASYLDCGILAHGFARARCGDCGHTVVIAFSCKGRGVCPSCNSRRMAEVAALSVDDVAAVQQQVRTRVLRWFVRHGTLDATDALDMAGWAHGGGFSLDASVRIEALDRAGLERLLRYCARRPLALDRLQQINPEQLVYRLSKARLDGCAALRLTPLELIARLAALIPPPRLHRHRYHGVLAPNSPRRAQVTALGRAANPSPPPPLAAQASAPEPALRPATARLAWALLLARIYENFPLLCPQCGGDLRIIAFITEPPAIKAILAHLGEPIAPPIVAPARGPPRWNLAIEPVPDWVDTPQPAPAFDFDQRRYG